MSRLPSIQVGDQPRIAARLRHGGAFHQPAGDGHDQGHGHVGGVFGEHARGVGDHDAARVGGVDVDVVHAGAEVGDDPQPRTGARRSASVSMRR